MSNEEWKLECETLAEGYALVGMDAVADWYYDSLYEVCLPDILRLVKS